jgi:CRP/FNR family transcriptional regulator, cyclic AMP receptor protein
VTDPKLRNFNAEDFLANAGLGRRIVRLKAREAFFSQGGEADSIFYLQKGRAKLTVFSAAGKEATLTLLVPCDFVGEESIAGAVGRRLATATAISACTALEYRAGGDDPGDARGACFLRSLPQVSPCPEYAHAG